MNITQVVLTDHNKQPIFLAEIVSVREDTAFFWRPVFNGIIGERLNPDIHTMGYLLDHTLNALKESY